MELFHLSILYRVLCGSANYFGQCDSSNSLIFRHPFGSDKAPITSLYGTVARSAAALLTGGLLTWLHIDRTLNAASAPIQYVCINHRRLYILVTQ